MIVCPWYQVSHWVHALRIFAFVAQRLRSFWKQYVRGSDLDYALNNANCTLTVQKHMEDNRMNLLKLIAAFGAIALSGSPLLAAEIYDFDKSHTEIMFSYNHFGQSTAFGEFRDYSGTITLDPDNLKASSVNVTIKAASLDTGVEALDTHLKSKDFFEVESYPDIKFVSTSVEVTGDKTANLTGDLTIKAKTAPVTLAVTLNYKGRHALAEFISDYDVEVAGFSAIATLKRSDFGVDLYAPGVSDEVDLRIETELFRQE